MKKKGSGATKVVATIRQKPKAKLTSFHTPFDEFSVATVDELLTVINEVKLPEAIVEVSTAQDTPHVVCMQPLTHVVIHSPEAQSSLEAEHVYAMYQYCPHCKVAVRVL